MIDVVIGGLCENKKEESIFSHKTVSDAIESIPSDPGTDRRGKVVLAQKQYVAGRFPSVRKMSGEPGTDRDGWYASFGRLNGK